MNIREISKPVTAAALNESLARKFGSKIALEKFTLEQLQDVRNKIRTTLSQVETNESFNVVQSESYQKNKLFLDVLNAEISEREDVAENKTKVSDCDKTCPKSCPDCGGTGDPAKYKKDMKEAAKPDYIDIDGDGDKKEPMKKAVKDKEKKKKTDEAKKVGAPAPKPYKAPAKGQCKPGYVFDIKTGMCNPDTKAMKSESIVREGAEDQAEIVMAAKDMVNRVTSWMEDTAEMQTESMLELADAIRDEQGQEKSDAFVQTVKPALESLYTAMESTRESLTQGVGQLTGEAAPVTDMGAEPEEPDMEPTVDADAAAGGEDLDVSLDAAPAGAGGEAEAGREKRESRMHKRKMLETSRRLGTILSKKK